MKHILKAAACAAIAACAISAPASAMSPAGEEAMTKAGQVMFDHRCRSCHADDPGKQSYGPSLVGIFGRKAGTVEGFAYSDAMKTSGIVWTEPRDLRLDEMTFRINDPSGEPGIRDNELGGALVMFVNGVVEFYSAETDPQTIKGLLTVDGPGEKDDPQ